MSDILESCRWCRTSNLERRAFGAKARWIVENPHDDQLTQLVECRVCGLLYFTAEFTGAELTTMYSGYRGEDYFKRRHHYEPWYSRAINDGIGHSDRVLALRKSYLENLLNEASSQNRIVSPTRVLDIGGDEGQFIPDVDTVSARAVLEVSGIAPASNVEVLEDWSAAAAFAPDLVMMCHVLEHATDARQMVEEAHKVLKPSGLLYIEIPLDRPAHVPSFLKSPLQAKWTKFVSRHPRAFVLCDFFAQVSKRTVGTFAPASVVKQSEHINYFTHESLIYVLTLVGFRVISSGTYQPAEGVKFLGLDGAALLLERI